MSADHDLTDRLRALGQQPIDPALQSEHLTAMASVRGGRSVFRTSLAGRLKVALGVFAGFLLGASGLTAAGAMGPLQPIAADVVETVAPVDVPKGKADEAKAAAKAAKAVRAAAEGDEAKGGASRLEDGSIGTQRIWDGCVPTADGETFAGNRGQYLKQERAKGAEAYEAAKASDCGKPVADDDEDADDVEATEAPKAEDTDDDATEGEGKGLETAPGQNGERGKSDDAGKPADAGKSSDAGKSEDAPKPSTVPSPELPDQADDDATSKAPTHAPGTPAEPEGKPEDA
jgi:hypothetical protein